MTHDDFLKIEKQFHAYASPFVDKAEDPYPFVLKQTHTARVCRAMEMLCASLDLDSSKTTRALLETRQNDSSCVTTLNNMRIFQAGMVYDLNFPAAAAAILELEVIPVLLGGIPPSELITRLAQALLGHLKFLAASVVILS